MLSPKYLTLLPIFLLPVLNASEDDDAYCKNGNMTVYNVSQILAVINEHRMELASVEVYDPDGNLLLPVAKNMRKMAYDCTLEQEAKDFLEALGCAAAIPEQQEPNKGYCFLHYRIDEYSPLSDDLKLSLEAARNSFISQGKSISKYTKEDRSLHYANLMRSSASKVGCAVKKCTNGEDEGIYMDLCLTDESNIRDGDKIYELREGEKCECDKPWTCSDDSLCIPPAKFPGSNDEEPSTLCSSTEISDTMRMHMQDTHNYRRSQLALAKVTDNKGKTLPAASNMNYLVWNCSLEREAHDFLRDCPTKGYLRPDDRSPAQNFYYGTTDEPTFRDMNKKAVSEWWKQVRKVAGPGTNAFTTKHSNTEIKSFTLMGWASSKEMGCSIAECGSYWVEACRYYPPGNKVGDSMYLRGTACTKCDASGANSCDRSLGLCGSEK